MKSILNLQFPVIGLSPIDGISDYAFREITKKYGNPDLMYTEFVNVMGLCIAGYNTLRELDYSEIQRPIIGQIYGKEIEYFYHAAKILTAIGFDGIDINMGCPAKNVAASGAGAGLIRTPELAREIIEATKEGVRHWVEDGILTGLNNKTEQAVLAVIDGHIKELNNQHTPDIRHSSGQLNLFSQKKGRSSFQRVVIPVSVKTRIGFDKPITESWISNLDAANPAWIAVHGRTLKQLYTGFSDRTELKKAVNSTSKAVLVNGDIKDREDAVKVIKETGAFGALIARASFGNPWVFNKIKSNLDVQVEDLSTNKEDKDLMLKSLNYKLDVMLEHTKLFVAKNPDPKAFVQMRKHYGWYIKGFDGAKELRMKLMSSNSLNEVNEILDSTLKSSQSSL